MFLVMISATYFEILVLVPEKRTKSSFFARTAPAILTYCWWKCKMFVSKDYCSLSDDGAKNKNPMSAGYLSASTGNIPTKGWPGTISDCISEFFKMQRMSLTLLRGIVMIGFKSILQILRMSHLDPPHFSNFLQNISEKNLSQLYLASPDLTRPKNTWNLGKGYQLPINFSHSACGYHLPICIEFFYKI